MIQIVHCSYCSGSGPMNVDVKYVVKNKSCKTCHHDESAKWYYYFCKLTCFLKWTANIVRDGGIACNDCIGLLPDQNVMGPTGFAYGHEANGVCKTCNGTKVVKVSQ